MKIDRKICKRKLYHITFENVVLIRHVSRVEILEITTGKYYNSCLQIFKPGVGNHPVITCAHLSEVDWGAQSLYK